MSSSWCGIIIEQICTVDYKTYSAINVGNKYLGISATNFITGNLSGIELDLSHNNISRLEAKLPDNISKIDLSHNFLDTVPDPELLPSSLKSLYLKNNQIRSLKDATLNYFKTFESLRRKTF